MHDLPDKLTIYKDKNGNILEIKINGATLHAVKDITYNNEIECVPEITITFAGSIETINAEDELCEKYNRQVVANNTNSDSPADMFDEYGKDWV